MLHLSDVHLDAGLRATGIRSSRARERCAAHLEAFDRALEVAAARHIDLVLLAGDLFEASRVRPATVRHVVNRLAAWGRPVAVAPGNHDPWNADSPYTLVEWPPNVRIFRGTWEAWELPELGVVVHGRGFEAPEETAPLFADLHVPDAGRHVVVAHGSDLSSRPDRHDPYRPFEPADIERLPAAYVALGHFHRFQRLATRTPAAYSGSPVAQGFQDTGEHGVVCIELQPDDTVIEFVPLPGRRFVTLDVAVGGAETPAEIRQQALAAVTARDLAADFVRVRLQGSLTPDLEVDVEDLGAALEPHAHEVEILDQTVPEYDLEHLAQEQTVRGRFVRALLERLPSAPPAEREVLRRAVYYGLDAFAGRPQER